MTRLLVIEDNNLLLQGVTTILELEGYETLIAADGISGLEQARQNLPDLILCDVNLPRLDGYGVLEAVRTDICLAQTPFLFLSAAAGQESIRRALELGADGYLLKPFDVPDLLEAIRLGIECPDRAIAIPFHCGGRPHATMFGTPSAG
jgi:two-component system sensor histidine kinase/response regulator